MQALEGVGVPQVESSKSSGIQDRIYDVVGVAQFLFHWGFLPAVIYLGKKIREDNNELVIIS